MKNTESQITIHGAFLPGQESKGNINIICYFCFSTDVILKEQNIWIIKNDPLMVQRGQDYLHFNFANRVNDALICS